MRIELDKGDLLKVKTMLAGVANGAPRVITRAINKTLTNVQTKAAAEIGLDLNLPAKRIKQDFALDKANYSKLSGRFVSKGGPVGLASFTGTRQVKAGVSVKVHKSKPRTTLKHAFIATAKNATNVFWRAYEGPRKKLRPGFSYGALPKIYRMPVHRLTGPRVEDELAKPKVIDAVMAHADERFEYNLDHELEYELSKL